MQSKSKLKSRAKASHVIVVAVGSMRRPKVAAVREVLADVGSILQPGAMFRVLAVDVPSGVRHTPLSRDETMSGARERAQALRRIAREKHAPWDYFVGLEGGLDIVQHGGKRWVFLENWAYVCDREGRESVGQSGAILLPEALVTRVVGEGIELAEAIDEFAGLRGVRDAQGAWGVLTNNLVTRQDAFRLAVLNAFTPFFRRAVLA